MSLPVFIHPDLRGAAPGQSVHLDGAEGRHAVTVKRLKPTEQLELTDGTGRVVTAEVTATAGKDQLDAAVTAVRAEPAPHPKVVVVQAIPKSERAELAVDLATQAGADEIIAWQADRCVAKWEGKKIPKALAKWEATAQAAAKQSRRARIPQVRGPVSTGELTQLLAQADHALVLHEEATRSIREAQLSGTVYLLVGPEGGIGSAELERLTQAGAQPIKLGPQVLRTASAAMVALAAIGALTERW
ncbi:16S rRNA (uracil(1498)-N(3))-methyltransferase [Corynebacterium sp. HMSC04H06]|uniref:16S rRNA (uracil(1498)-N(3))-methyltransferase n=1 Tax=Corynebacterium sp. HMSC04H06 TaxID=1581050 RepID=UPI0008A1FCA5|nr:16S rRNA (uracil(1498)-N(3))-methyltransferase [Corynebacterium sp. HMSC04H06]OFS21496.1 16S rRNA (uracil(1498)-N(3))-methyltransferase [Corynebacterium sp. HMSC04H06]